MELAKLPSTYLQQKGTDRTYAFEANLAAREDMRLIIDGREVVNTYAQKRKEEKAAMLNPEQEQQLAQLSTENAALREQMQLQNQQHIDQLAQLTARIDAMSPAAVAAVPNAPTTTVPPAVPTPPVTGIQLPNIQ